MTSILALQTAIPYLRKYRNRTFVVKVGGSLLKNPENFKHLLEQIGALYHLGIRIVVVHGGGAKLERLAEKLDVPQRKIAGRRVTSDGTIELAKMVYAGEINTDLVAALVRQEIRAVGLSGVDSGIVRARRRPPVEIDGETVDFGHVGDIVSVDTALLQSLLASDAMPVFSTLCLDENDQTVNVNADTFAQHVAVALKAEKYVNVTDVAGILRDVGDPRSLVSYADFATIESMKADKLLTGGILPKVDACVRAVAGGVKRAHIIDGNARDGLLREIFTNEGAGTLIVDKMEAPNQGS